MSKKILAVLGSCVLLAVYCMPGVTPIASAARLTIAGGSLGGTGFLYASALAGVAKKSLGIDATVVTVPNVKAPIMMVNGIVDIAVSQPNVDYETYTATGYWKGKPPLKQLRTMFYRGPLYWHLLVRKDSPIKSYSDLAGKRICAGVKGTAQEKLFRNTVVQGLGLKDKLDIVSLGYEEGGAALVTGKIDAYFVWVEPPHPTLAQFDLKTPMTLVPMTDKEIEMIEKYAPWAGRAVIEPKYYHMDKPVQTLVGLGSFVTTTTLKEDMAYKIAKGWVENPDVLGYYRKSIEKFVKEGGLKKHMESYDRGVPYHPGSYRFFKEAGWKIPSAMAPPK